jgi:hypothetical protein
MDTSALSSEMAMRRRPIAKSGLFSLVSIKEVHLQGGAFFGFWRSPFPFVAVVYRNVGPRCNLRERRMRRKACVARGLLNSPWYAIRLEPQLKTQASGLFMILLSQLSGLPPASRLYKQPFYDVNYFF